MKLAVNIRGGGGKSLVNFTNYLNAVSQCFSRKGGSREHAIYFEKNPQGGYEPSKHLRGKRVQGEGYMPVLETQDGQRDFFLQAW